MPYLGHGKPNSKTGLLLPILGTAGKTLKEDKAMSEVTDRKFTMLDKSDLEEFIKAYDRSHGPVFGQYPPNLYFSQQQQQAADADQQARPDDFYYQGQGQEPPSPEKTLASLVCQEL
jgi:hypothetical protein